MCKLVFITSTVLFFSCASPKYVYYFDSYRSPKNDSVHVFDGVKATGLIADNNLSTGSLEGEVYRKRTFIDDTGVASNDTLPGQQQNQKTYSPDSKEAKKKAYDERKKAYLEAKKAYAATKNKRLDGFAIAGAVFLTVAFLLIGYPVAAVFFGIIGLISSVLGLKSRIWGLSAAVLIAGGVLLTLYIFMSIIVNSGGD